MGLAGLLWFIKPDRSTDVFTPFEMLYSDVGVLLFLVRLVKMASLLLTLLNLVGSRLVNNEHKLMGSFNTSD